MRRGLRFRHRIAILVALAAIALVIVTVVTLVLGGESERQLTGIETRYVPLIELDRDLKAAFAAIPRAFEDAAAAGDEARLAQAIAASEQFTQRLAAAAPAITANGGDAPRLQGEFRTYYQVARDVTTALVSSTPADRITANSSDVSDEPHVPLARISAIRASAAGGKSLLTDLAYPFPLAVD